MPCRCDYDEPVYHEHKVHDKQLSDLNRALREANASNEQFVKDIHMLKGTADRLTQLLCYSCGLIREAGITYDARLGDWIKEHDAWDNQRTLKTMQEEFPDGNVTKSGALNWFIKSAEKVHPLSNWHKTVFFDGVWNQFKKWADLRDKAVQLKKEKLAQIAKLRAEIEEIDKTCPDSDILDNG